MAKRPALPSRIGAVQLPAFGKRIFDTRHLPSVVRDTKRGPFDEISKLVHGVNNWKQESSAATVHTRRGEDSPVAAQTTRRNILVGVSLNQTKKVHRVSGYAHARLHLPEPCGYVFCRNNAL